MPKKDGSIYLNCICTVFPSSDSNFFWGPGIRDCYVLHFVRKGKGYFECDGRKYSLSAGDSFFIAPGMLINYYPDPDDPWVYAWTDFGGLEAKGLLKYCALSVKNPISPYKAPKLEGLFKQAAAAFGWSSAADICRNDAYLRLILSEYIRLYPAFPENERTDTVTSKAAEYIENNYRHTELDIDSISKELGVSRATLHRKFTDEFGLSPGAYITELRIKKACALLSSTDFSIKLISYSTGFSNQLYFSRVFKKQMGLTPSEYKASHLGMG